MWRCLEIVDAILHVRTGASDCRRIGRPRSQFFLGIRQLLAQRSAARLQLLELHVLTRLGRGSLQLQESSAGLLQLLLASLRGLRRALQFPCSRRQQAPVFVQLLPKLFPLHADFRQSRVSARGLHVGCQTLGLQPLELLLAHRPLGAKLAGHELSLTARASLQIRKPPPFFLQLRAGSGELPAILIHAAKLDFQLDFGVSMTLFFRSEPRLRGSELVAATLQLRLLPPHFVQLVPRGCQRSVHFRASRSMRLGQLLVQPLLLAPLSVLLRLQLAGNSASLALGASRHFGQPLLLLLSLSQLFLQPLALLLQAGLLSVQLGFASLQILLLLANLLARRLAVGGLQLGLCLAQAGFGLLDFLLPALQLRLLFLDLLRQGTLLCQRRLLRRRERLLQPRETPRAVP